MFEIDHRLLQRITRDRSVPRLADVRNITARIDAGLDCADLNRLINAMGAPDFARIKQHVLSVAREIRTALFGNCVVPMAPVEVSNICASDCLFCGWRCSNTEMERVLISEDLVMEQIRYLVDKGIHYIELVGGDDFNFVRGSLPSLIRSVRQLGREMGKEITICFCTMSLATAHYRELQRLGADAMIVWQETYDPACYRRHILNGPKRHGVTAGWKVPPDGDGYTFRLHAQERALDANLDVAMGTILGLNEDLNFEILSAITHLRYLQQHPRVSARHPVIVGLPTWNRIPTASTDQRPADRASIEPFFSYIASLYLLACPSKATWVFPNCRVGFAQQIEATWAAGVFTSTEVKLGPGGYLPAVLTEKRRRGECTRALEELILFEFSGRGHDVNAVFDALDRKEQFVHHYATHDDYVSRMEDAGLTVLCSATLPANGPTRGSDARPPVSRRLPDQSGRKASVS